MTPLASVVTLLVFLASGAARAADAPATDVAKGAALFARYCVSCHGTRGVGDGPVAPALTTEPADLTQISARNGGRFPTDRIRDQIDGRAVVPAHGPREMPVWGYELEAQAPEDAPGRATAQAMTDQLVAYLQSIQREMP